MGSDQNKPNPHLFDFSPFELPSAEDWQIDAWYCFLRDIRLESVPDKPVFSKEELIQRTESMAILYETEYWVLWNPDDKSLMALCGLRHWKRDQADSPVHFHITVARRHRRKGIGNAMLGKIAECARRDSTKNLSCFTSNLFPAGEIFIERTGALCKNETSFNKLHIKDVKRDVVDNWLRLPADKNNMIKIGTWENEFPENRIDEICEFYQTVFDAEKDKHGNEGFKYTRDVIRKIEKSFLTGSNKLTVYADDCISGKLLGFTEIYWSLLRPSTISQKYTAVLPSARKRGIARRLKAEMLTKIMQELPDDVSIGTGNASLNQSILNINSEVGFKLHNSQKTWQLETDALVKFTGIPPVRHSLLNSKSFAGRA